MLLGILQYDCLTGSALAIQFNISQLINTFQILPMLDCFLSPGLILRTVGI